MKRASVTVAISGAIAIASCLTGQLLAADKPLAGYTVLVVENLTIEKGEKEEAVIESAGDVVDRFLDDIKKQR